MVYTCNDNFRWTHTAARTLRRAGSGEARSATAVFQGASASGKSFEFSGKLLSLQFDVRQSAAAEVVVRNDLAEVIIKRVNQDTLARIVQPIVILLNVEEIGVDDFLKTQMTNDVIRPKAKRLNEVVGKHWPVVFVAVHNPDERVNSGLDEGRLHLAVEHPVGVIQQRVKHIFGGMLGAVRKLVLRRNNPADKRKVPFTARPLQPPKRRKGFVGIRYGVFSEFVLVSFYLDRHQLRFGVVVRWLPIVQDFQDGQLVFNLSNQRLFHPRNSLGTRRKTELIFTNGAYRAEAVTPHPAKRKAFSVNKLEVNLIFHGQQDGFVRYFGGGVKFNTFELANGDKVLLVAGPNPKSAIFYGEATAFFI